MYFKSLKEHKKKIHQVKFIVCDWPGCNLKLKYGSATVLDLHVRRTHTFEKPFKCEECEKKFYTMSLLRDHRREHTGDNFECEVCHKVFVRRKQLYYHRKVHRIQNSNEILKCDECDYTTRFPSGLKYHKKNNHSTGPAPDFKCDYEGCHKTYRSLKSLKEHKRIVHSKQVYICEWPGCDKQYKTKKSHKLHRLTHEMTTKPFKCDVEGCDKEFEFKHFFDRHKDRHIRPVVCDWPECGVRFERNTELKAHTNKHLNVTPYVCSYEGCGKAFTSKFYLRKHINYVHKRIGNPFKPRPGTQLVPK